VSFIVDARGLPCPDPVIMTRNALQEHAAVITIVDNVTAQRNVTHVAERAGYQVHAEQKADGIYLQIAKVEQATEPVPAPQAAIATAGPLVLLVADDQMGRGDPELGQILIRAFFHTLHEITPLPETIIFLNSGVRLVVEGSEVLEDLKLLCGRGIKLSACGTCLGYYELKDKIAVGEISNMYTIAETLMGAGKVVRL